MKQIREETITQAEYTGKEKYLNNVRGTEGCKQGPAKLENFPYFHD